ncbi:MAG: suppressor of fused domain protein, partial [Planctomycetes bacterium]|nr:suppressor of fused domain protein [Planctomycetota bacterium]
ILLDAGIDPHVVYRFRSGELTNAFSYATEYGQPGVAELLESCGCRMPVEGVDIPVYEAPREEPEEEDQTETSTAEDATQQIIDHMEEAFGPVDSFSLQEILPVDDEIHVSVHVIQPNDRHPFLTLFTTGMSDKAMNVPEGQDWYAHAELVMHLPGNWPHPKDAVHDDNHNWPVQWLRQLAYFPHRNQTWMGGKYTIVSTDDPPQPVGPNTKQTCFLLISGLTNCPELMLSDKVINFYSITGLYTDERDLEQAKGFQVLLDALFEQDFLMMIDVDRPNAAVKKKQ